ncbi:resistance to lethality of mkk1p386 overexpression [Elasticomyces elasticus]|nr:resistance to lethality of mkk1p386 overexpression [Elasticomyces elasticus]KAK4979858.1 resistance to lethality of mkk1p386 overexpression [Elasticomyces elasticus]
MGRRKIEIKPIRDDRNRSVTFLKRKGGLFKKAHELSVLCSVDVAVIIFGTNKKLYEYSSSDVNEIIGRFQYYGGAHEHKGPADFADKGATAGDDDDDDGEGGDEGAGGVEGEQRRGTPVPPGMGEQQMQMQGQQPQPGMVVMQNHPGFQHVRHGTPGTPPMHNGGPMPQQFARGPSPLPPGISRPSSRTQDHPGHVRRVSSNLMAPGLMPQQGPPPQGGPPPGSYAYTPNPPFYNPQAQAQAQAQQMQQRPVQQASYPPPYPPPQPGQPQPPMHPQVQQAMMQEAAARRQSGPPSFPPQHQGPPPQAQMQGPRHPSIDHLQPPQPGGPRRQPSPGPHQGQGPPRPSPSPQPGQHEFASPPIPQPRPLGRAQAAQSIFTPIDDSRSMLAQHWGATSNSLDSKIDPAIKLEGGPRPASVDIAAMGRERVHAGRASPKRMTGMAGNKIMGSPAPMPQSRAGSVASLPGGGPTRSNTMQSGPKKPRLALHIPSEAEDGEGATPGIDDSGGASQQTTANPAGGRLMHLPPPSPSNGGALLSAGAQGPSNPFARPLPPQQQPGEGVRMSTNPHAVNRDAIPPPGDRGVAGLRIETPMSALPSRFMRDDLLPSPSSFFPEWGMGLNSAGGMSAGGGMGGMQMPSPLNFQTPGGWSREEDRKRPAEDGEGGGGDAKRAKGG